MSVKRKDTKGRILRDGESQRKDGRYEYKYLDAAGVRRSVYSWKLVATDKVPDGKRCKESLREMEQQIRRDLEDDINTFAGKSITVDSMFDRMMSLKSNIRPSTRHNYQVQYRTNISPYIGTAQIGKVKHSDIKRLYMELSGTRKLAIGTIEFLDRILVQIFNEAVKDDLVRTNPVTDAIKSVRSTADKRSKPHALTKSQQALFVQYVNTSKIHRHYAPLVAFLLGTGCRIGEATGLQWDDIDFQNNTITVRNNLICARDKDGAPEYVVSAPKSAAGVRVIPMLEAVRRALKCLSDERKQGVNISVSGYNNFVFSTKHGKLLTPKAAGHIIADIAISYNRVATQMAKDGKPCELLPKVTPHILRHTFCTRMCEEETNVKVVQDIMGHSTIAITMDVYNSASPDLKSKSIQKLEGKFSVG